MKTQTVILPMSTKQCDNVTACKHLVRGKVMPQIAPMTSRATTVCQLRFPTEKTPTAVGTKRQRTNSCTRG
jgi:hypothetical protein